MQSAFVAATNESNEFGRVLVERTHPFTSQSSDLLQAALQCNADYQYLDRVAPLISPESLDLRVNAREDRVLYGVPSSSALLDI